MSTNDRHIVISHSVCFLEALKMFYLFSLSFACNYQSNISLYSGIEPLRPLTSAHTSYLSQAPQAVPV